MKIAIISDVHITNNSDQADRLLTSFFNKCIDDKYETIILLGDIFDFMCGNKNEYLSRYPNFFSVLKRSLEKNIQIYYFEGNHDFNLSKLFKDFCKNNFLNLSNFIYIKDYLILEINDKKYYISHGDDLDISDYYYRLYKFIIKSKIIIFLMDRILSYNLLNKLGNYLAKTSKEHNNYKDSKVILLKEAYRLFALNKAKKGFDYIIAGHCHVKDDFEYKKNNINFRYLNNGFALNSKSYIHIDQENVNFVAID
jgi:UDP-2,3-diacylglucosamine hydrolase